MEKIKCKYCGRPLKSVTSRNLGFGPECARKNYKPRTLLQAIEDSKKVASNDVKRRRAYMKSFMELLSFVSHKVELSDSKVISIPKRFTNVLQSSEISPILERKFNITLQLED